MLRLPRARTVVHLTVAALGLAVVAACGGSTPLSGSGTPGTSESTAASGGASGTATGRTLTVTVTGKQVTPAPATVDLAVGETLTLTVTSDHDDQLHAHGFEIERDVKAGVPTTVVLKGAEPGLYDVEMHHPELKLLSVAVR
jgi:plastocyanin